MTCDIEGVVIRKLARRADARGWLAELFRHDELSPQVYPVMSYVSMTRPGMARGPHEHREQTDLFCFLGPSTFRLYLWDNRPGSHTYRAKCVLQFDEDSPGMVIVPPGVVHAYKNAGSVEGLVFNAPDRLYAGEGRSGPVDEIRHENDSASLFTTDE